MALTARAISGNIGVGKSTLCDNLGKILAESKVVLEQFENNEFLPLFYQELEKTGPNSYNKYSLPSQLQFLSNRIANESLCKDLNKIFIVERSIIEDRFVFVENMFRSGLLSREELHKFDQERLERSKDLEPVDIFIYLRANPHKLKERIEIRGREMEKNLSLEYLHHLNDLYENNLLSELEKNPVCQTMIYDVDEIDPVDLAYTVQQDLEKAVGHIVQSWSNSENS